LGRQPLSWALPTSHLVFFAEPRWKITKISHNHSGWTIWLSSSSKKYSNIEHWTKMEVS
jgi:hypothetical protein